MKIASNLSLPKSYNAAVLHEANQSLKIEPREMVSMQLGEALVKLQAAPINPSDLAILAGTYPHQKMYPFVPGLEGAGIVVASGGGFLANRLLGKHVACSPEDTGDGTWAEYMKVPATKCVELNSKLTFEQGATALVNPLTALALLSRVKKKGNSFVNTAAAGALGNMLQELAKRERLTVINIVRSEKQVNQQRESGAEIVLNSNDASFIDDYRLTCKKHNANVILDAVGGSFANTLLEGTEPGTELIAYATLSQENIAVAPQQIIRQHKKITGFHLGTWLGEQPLYKKLLLVRRAQKLISKGVLHTPVHQHFSLQEINEAVAAYKKNMSAGKWLLRF